MADKEKNQNNLAVNDIVKRKILEMAESIKAEEPLKYDSKDMAGNDDKNKTKSL